MRKNSLARDASLFLLAPAFCIGTAHAEVIDILCRRTDIQSNSVLSIRIDARNSEVRTGSRPTVSFGGHEVNVKHLYMNDTRIDLHVTGSLSDWIEYYFIDRISGEARVKSFPKGETPSESVYSCAPAKPKF